MSTFFVQLSRKILRSAIESQVRYRVSRTLLANAGTNLKQKLLFACLHASQAIITVYTAQGLANKCPCRCLMKRCCPDLPQCSRYSRTRTSNLVTKVQSSYRERRSIMNMDSKLPLSNSLACGSYSVQQIGEHNETLCPHQLYVGVQTLFTKNVFLYTVAIYHLSPKTG